VSGLGLELSRHQQVPLDQFTETDLLREAAWVILCSGFREQVVRRIFDFISLCFCDWESAEAIILSQPACRNAAMERFRNPAKLDAIVSVAELINARTFVSLKAAVILDPIAELKQLSFIRPINAFHLAKNLGMDTAKPDRHLMRLSKHFGFKAANELCGAISCATGETVARVDLILWRYIADRGFSSAIAEDVA
jgi:hypothetical protein